MSKLDVLLKPKSDPQKKSLADMLEEMTTFDNNQYTEEERIEIAAANNDNIAYDEYIHPSFAKALLGNDYDPTCTYKLSTLPTATVVLKINPNIPEDKPPVLDSKGNIIEAHIMEYPLVEDEEQYDTYIQETTFRTSVMEDKPAPRPKVNTMHLVIAALCALLVVWLGIVIWLVKLGGL